MNKETLTALNKSIRKYERRINTIKDARETIKEYGVYVTFISRSGNPIAYVFSSDECPLYGLFLRWVRGITCNGCPVQNCTCSPWYTFLKLETNDKTKIVEVLTAELNFLRSLRPKGWRKFKASGNC